MALVLLALHFTSGSLQSRNASRALLSSHVKDRLAQHSAAIHAQQDVNCKADNVGDLADMISAMSISPAQTPAAEMSISMLQTPEPEPQEAAEIPTSKPKGKPKSKVPGRPKGRSSQQERPVRQTAKQKKVRGSNGLSEMMLQRRINETLTLRRQARDNEKDPKYGEWWEMVVPGNPTPLGRPRFTKWGRAYDPSKKAKLQVVEDCKYQLPLEPPEDPLVVRLEFYMKRPKVQFSKRSGLKGWAPKYHAGVPDIDNLAKFILDSFNGYLYQDDRQIVELQLRKIYLDEDLPNGYTKIGLWRLKQTNISSSDKDVPNDVYSQSHINNE